MADAVEDVFGILERQMAQRGAAAVSGGAGGGPGTAPAGRESFVLVVGSLRSGKSTLINHFLATAGDEAPRPTIALEYQFGRRTNPVSNAKEIAHVWELGGGVKLAELMAVPLTPQRMVTGLVIIVLDLSKPGDVLEHAATWLRLVRSRVADCVERLRAKAPATVASVQAEANARVGLPGHADARLLTPLLVPLILVGAKYDVFQELEPLQRRPVIDSLRYLAHLYGAALVTTSTRDRASLTQFRAFATHFVFGTPLRRGVGGGAVNPLAPLAIAPGSDSLDAIGLPHGAGAADVDSPASRFGRVVDLWKAAIAVYCRPSPDQASLGMALSGKGGEGGGGGEDGEGEGGGAEDLAAAYPEPIIDALRAQKAAELAAYAKEARRRLKLEAQRAAESRAAPGAAAGGAGAVLGRAGASAPGGGGDGAGGTGSTLGGTGRRK